jgi:hypothetical protein
MGIGLGKTHARLRQFVDIGRDQVLGSIATGIQGSLVIGEDKDDIGFSGSGASQGERNKGWN